MNNYPTNPHPIQTVEPALLKWELVKFQANLSYDMPLEQWINFCEFLQQPVARGS